MGMPSLIDVDTIPWEYTAEIKSGDGQFVPATFPHIRPQHIRSNVGATNAEMPSC